MRTGLIWHIIVVSLILLLSAIMNSYSITVLSKEISNRGKILSKVSWIEDSIKYVRFSEPYR